MTSVLYIAFSFFSSRWKHQSKLLPLLRNILTNEDAWEDLKFHSIFSLPFITNKMKQAYCFYKKKCTGQNISSTFKGIIQNFWKVCFLTDHPVAVYYKRFVLVQLGPIILAEVILKEKKKWQADNGCSTYFLSQKHIFQQENNPPLAFPVKLTDKVMATVQHQKANFTTSKNKNFINLRIIIRAKSFWGFTTN